MPEQECSCPRQIITINGRCRQCGKYREQEPQEQGFEEWLAHQKKRCTMCIGDGCFYCNNIGEIEKIPSLEEAHIAGQESRQPEIDRKDNQLNDYADQVKTLNHEVAQLENEIDRLKEELENLGKWHNALRKQLTKIGVVPDA